MIITISDMWKNQQKMLDNDNQIKLSSLIVILAVAQASPWSGRRRAGGAGGAATAGGGGARAGRACDWCRRAPAVGWARMRAGPNVGSACGRVGFSLPHRPAEARWGRGWGGSGGGAGRAGRAAPRRVLACGRKYACAGARVFACMRTRANPYAHACMRAWAVARGHGHARETT